MTLGCFVSLISRFKRVEYAKRPLGREMNYEGTKNPPHHRPSLWHSAPYVIMGNINMPMFRLRRGTSLFLVANVEYPIGLSSSWANKSKEVAIRNLNTGILVFPIIT